MAPHRPALIIGGQHIPPRAVGGQKRGRVGRRDRPLGREPTGGGVDPEARNRWHRAIPDIEHVPIRAEREHGRPPRDRHLALGRQVTGPSIQSKNAYLVLVLQGNVHVRWHGSTSSACAQASCRLRYWTPLTAGAVQSDPTPVVRTIIAA